MIDAFHNHAIEKESLANELNEIEIEKVSLFARNSKLEVKVAKNKNENKMLSDKLEKITEKVEASKSFTSLEEKLKKVSLELTASLERNRELEKNLNSIKNDLEKSLSWTAALETLTKLSNMSQILKVLDLKRTFRYTILIANMHLFHIIGCVLIVGGMVITKKIVKSSSNQREKI